MEPAEPDLVEVEAAIDVEGLAGHTVAQGAGEEEAGGGDVGGEDAAVEALIGDDGADVVGVGVDVFAFGFDGAGGDGVDVNVVAAHFAGEGAGEAEDRAFGGDVVDELFDADPDGDGADVDDFAGAAGDHVGEGELAEVHEAFDVDGLHAIPVGFGGFEEEAAGVDAGVVDEGVDVAVAGDGGVDGGFAVGTVGYVALEGVGGAAGGVDLSGLGLGSGFVDIEDVDVGAVLGEEFGDARADAKGGAGDERDVVVREHREQDNAGGAGVGEEKIRVVYDAAPEMPLATGGRVLAPATDDPKKGSALAREAARLAGVKLEFSSDLVKDLPEARLLVYISHEEGLGSAALLAQAAGVPVLASRVGGLQEVVEHGVTGALVANDAEAIAEAMRSLLGRDAGALAEMRLAAHGRWEERFTVARMVEGTLAAYGEVVGKGQAA